MTNIAVLGGGRIGEALISGLIAAGSDPQSITVTDLNPQRREQLRETYGIRDFADNRPAVDGADIVFLCVKPNIVVPLLEEVSSTLDDNDANTLIVSLAAGITLADMEGAVSAGTPVVRVMPNTPMLVGKGMSALAPGRFVNDEQMDVVKELLSTVGEVVAVSEKDLDAVTAMSGSAPAYFFLVAEALIDAGVNLGLTRDVAQKLVTTTAAGAGAMLAESGDDPTTLRINVSSPGGTTVAALRELEESGLRGAFFRAAQACADRSEELGAPQK